MTQEIIINIEQDDNGYYGWVNYEDNLIVVRSNSPEELEQEAKNVLYNFHNITDVKFKHNFI